MKNCTVEQYINNWIKRQNTGCGEDQKDSFSKNYYCRLLHIVATTIKENKDKSLDELREILYQKSDLEESIKHFIKERRMAPGLVVSYGTKNYKETLVIGNKQEVEMNQNGEIHQKEREMTADTIFDLASITKLFTSICILKLIQFRAINLEDKVKGILPQFKNLEDTTIFYLLAFQVPLKTNGRIDKATSKEEAEQLLFDIEIDKNNNNSRPYADMGAMILKYVIEKVTDIPYYDFLEKAVLKSNGLNDTYVIVPEAKIDRVAATNIDGFYYKDGNYRISNTPEIGTVYDPKARIMEQKEGNLSGHAGLFSSATDMTRLAKQLIEHNVLNSHFLKEISKNRTGKIIVNENDKAIMAQYIQYLGYLCYSKNPNLPDSEVYHPLSGEAFASAGWTGTQLTVDPLNEIYFFLGGNRSHNRMTYIDPVQKEKIREIGNKKVITLPNGIEMIDATRFAWDRDKEIVHKALDLTIEYKMLEDILSLFEKDLEKSEKIKQL